MPFKNRCSGSHPGVHALFDLAETLDDPGEHRDRDLRTPVEERSELLGGDLEGLHWLRRLDGREALAGRDERHLTEELSSLEAVEPAADVHLRRAADDDEHPVAGVAF